METIAESGGLSRCPPSLEISLQGRVSPSKKRLGGDHDLFEKDAQPSKRLKCTKPDELYGILNFMYLSPQARFFSMRLKDIAALRNNYPESYGIVPSDVEYEWSTEINSRLKMGSLHDVPVICNRVDWFTVYICLELQGQPGIPTLLGYEPVQYDFNVVRRQCSQDLPKSLTVEQMARQLLEVLHNIHKQGLVHAYLFPETVEWDGDNIIIPYWEHVQCRGDCNDFNYDEYDCAQPIKDLKSAGEIIKKWAMERNCLDKFEEFVKALTNPNPFMRPTARQALDMLCGKPIQRPNYLENDSIFVQYSYQHVTAQFVAQFESELLVAPHSVHELFNDTCQWHTEASKSRSTALKYGTRLGQKVFAKTRYGPKKLIAKENYVTKMMSGVSKHFPTVIESSAAWIPEGYESKKLKRGFILVMPEYNTEPREKNLRKTFSELLSTLKTLQRYGLVHRDIAPQNIMWDDNDDLILIDFGSVFMTNHEFMGPEPQYAGHDGYMAPEWVPNFASDIYSVARVMVYFMNQWKVRDDKMIEILRKMIRPHWYQRPTLDQIYESL